MQSLFGTKCRLVLSLLVLVLVLVPSPKKSPVNDMQNIRMAQDQGEDQPGLGQQSIVESDMDLEED